MKFPQLRATRGMVFAIAAAASMICTGVFAKAANPVLIPAKTAYVLSIPDIPAFWSAWKQNSIYQSFKKIMASPDVAEKTDQFNRQLRTIEAALGFSLNGETVAQIFKSGDVYLAPTERAGEASMGVIFNISDKEKLNKLMDLAEKAAAQAASQKEEEAPASNGTPAPAKPTGGADTDDSGSTGTATADANNPVSTETYKDTTIKRFSGREDSEIYYTLLGNYLLIANDRAEIKALVDRAAAAGSPTGETMAASLDYQSALNGLAQKGGELYVFGSQAAVMEMQQSQGGMENLQSLIRKIAPVNYWASSVKISPKEVYFYSHGTLATTGTQDSLPQKYPGDKPLEVVNYVPENTMLVVATSLLDSQLYFSFIDELFKMMGSKSDIEEQLKGVEAQIGFSIKEDLVPALGNEVAFALNSVKVSNSGPSVDGALIFRIADKAKMTKVLAGVEKLLGNMGGGATSASGDAKATPAPGGMQTAKAGNATIKYIEVPMMPSLTPGFAVDGDYLLIGTTRNALTDMIELKGGKGTGLTGSESYKKLGPRVTTTGNAFQYFNFSGIWETVGTLTQLLPQPEVATKVLEALKVFQVMGATSMTRNGALVSESLIILQ